MNVKITGLEIRDLYFAESSNPVISESLINMMIDVNACVGNWVFRPLPISSPPELSKMLSDEGVGKALVSSIEGIFYDDPQLANENLFDTIADLPSLMPVAVLNPALPNWEKSLNKSYESEIKAIKLYPNYHRYNIGDAKALLEQAGEMDIPVIIQLRVQDVRAQNPICIVPDVDVKKVVEGIAELPKTSFILGGIKWNEAQSMASVIKESRVMPSSTAAACGV